MTRGSGTGLLHVYLEAIVPTNQALIVKMYYGGLIELDASISGPTVSIVTNSHSHAICNRVHHLNIVCLKAGIQIQSKICVHAKTSIKIRNRNVWPECAGARTKCQWTKCRSNLHRRTKCRPVLGQGGRNAGFMKSYFNEQIMLN